MPSESRHAGHTRREVLILGVGATPLVGFGALAVEALATAPNDRRLVGVIEEIEPGAFVVRSNGRKRIEVDSSTEFWRDHSVAASGFIVRDEVVAVGRWEGDAFHASRVESAYRMLDDRVTERMGADIQLSEGPLRFTHDTRPAGRAGVAYEKDLDLIAPGDHVVGIARWEPAIDGLVALRIGVMS